MPDTPAPVVPCQPDMLARLPPLAAQVAAWVRLIDRAEEAMYPDDVDGDPGAPGEPGVYTQRAASSLWDAVYQVCHTLTPNERILARAYLWLRDKMALLPARAERAELGWALCPCTRCRSARLTTTARQQLAGCAPEAQNQYARVASVQLLPAFRATDDHQARSA